MIDTCVDLFTVRSIERAGGEEFWLTSKEGHGCGLAIVREAFELLKERNSVALSVRLFGDKKDLWQALSFLKGEMKDCSCPPLMLLQPDAEINIQIHAISGFSSELIDFDGETVGRKMTDSNAEYFMLNVMPDDKSATEFDQAANLFRKAHGILETLGCGFPNTIRTWLYAQKILTWYDQLNKARNAFFEKHDIYNKLVPASTGIGAMNPYGKAMATQVLAVAPKTGKISIQKAVSPLQCPALNYKSSFSRGIKLDAPDHRRLYVSGTASIDQTGKTVFIGDTAAQIKKTVQVLDAILKKADMKWSDVVSSIVYFRHKEELGMFDEFCRKHGLELPHVKLHADICRDNLLFEVELDAVKSL